MTKTTKCYYKFNFWLNLRSLVPSGWASNWDEQIKWAHNKGTMYTGTQTHNMPVTALSKCTYSAINHKILSEMDIFFEIFYKSLSVFLET